MMPSEILMPAFFDICPTTLVSASTANLLPIITPTKRVIMFSDSSSNCWLTLVNEGQP